MVRSQRSVGIVGVWVNYEQIFAIVMIIGLFDLWVLVSEKVHHVVNHTILLVGILENLADFSWSLHNVIIFRGVHRNEGVVTCTAWVGIIDGWHHNDFSIAKQVSYDCLRLLLILR